MQDEYEMPKRPHSERCLLAHELNNDLTVIYGHCDLLSEVLEIDAEIAMHLRIIREAAGHMARNLVERSCPLAANRKIAVGGSVDSWWV